MENLSSMTIRVVPMPDGGSDIQISYDPPLSVGQTLGTPHCFIGDKVQNYVLSIADMVDTTDFEYRGTDAAGNAVVCRTTERVPVNPKGKESCTSIAFRVPADEFCKAFDEAAALPEGLREILAQATAGVDEPAIVSGKVGVS